MEVLDIKLRAMLMDFEGAHILVDALDENVHSRQAAFFNVPNELVAYGDRTRVLATSRPAVNLVAFPDSTTNGKVVLFDAQKVDRDIDSHLASRKRHTPFTG